jgi:dihydropteroate synthase
MARWRIMGVLNVTPDSFSDGGEHLGARAAVARGRELIVQGAELIDVGGESTRPGAGAVSAADEIARTVPVIAGLRGAGAGLSIDTTKSAVAEVALDAGAVLVNDVSAMRNDPAMAALVAERGCDCCLMHMLGEPRTMQDDPRYEDVIVEVRDFLAERAQAARDAGIAAERILVDPGIGFGKTIEHNLALLRGLGAIAALGFPVVIGTSRKSFLGRITGRDDPHERVAATVATSVLAFERGASVFRVHDVAATRDALLVAAATLPPHDA